MPSRLWSSDQAAGNSRSFRALMEGDCLLTPGKRMSEPEGGKDCSQEKGHVSVKKEPCDWYRYIDYKAINHKGNAMDLQEISTDNRFLRQASSGAQESSYESFSDTSVASIDLNSCVATVLKEEPCEWYVDHPGNKQPVERCNDSMDERGALVPLSTMANGYVEEPSIQSDKFQNGANVTIVKGGPHECSDGYAPEGMQSYVNHVVPGINGYFVLRGQDALNSILPDTSANVYNSVRRKKYTGPFAKVLNQKVKKPGLTHVQISARPILPRANTNLLPTFISNQYSNLPPSIVNVGLSNGGCQIRANRPADIICSQSVKPHPSGGIAFVNLMPQVVDDQNKSTVGHPASVRCNANKEIIVLNTASESVTSNNGDTNPCRVKVKKVNIQNKEILPQCSQNPANVPDKNGLIFVSGEKVLEILRSADAKNKSAPKETIVCEICGSSIKRFNLKGHVLMHTKDEMFLCRDCEMVFLKEEGFAITLHLLSHKKDFSKRIRLGSHGNRYLGTSNIPCANLEATLCDVCGDTVSTSTIKEHLLAHSSDHILECNQCKMIFLREGDFRTHLLKHTDKLLESEPFQITAKPLYENDVIRLVDKLLDDVEDMLAPPPVKRKRNRKKQQSLCDICGKQFTTLYSLQEHLKIHNDERRHRCGKCGKKFVALTALQKHRRTHTQERPYKCDDCGRSFRLQSTVYSHRTTHVKEKPYQCIVCKRAFSTPSNLKGHMVTHSDEKPYSCDVCHKAFNHKGALKRHLCYDKRVADKKLFACKTCGLVTVGMNPLKEHYRTAHKGERNIKCDLCPKKFYNQEQLKNHHVSHRKEREVACEVCSKMFKSSYNLKIHQRIHTGEKPYPCEVCGKCFSQSSSRNSHLLIHKNKKPFVCHICNKSFRQSTSLMKHRRFVHEEEPENSDEFGN